MDRQYKTVFELAVLTRCCHRPVYRRTNTFEDLYYLSEPGLKMQSWQTILIDASLFSKPQNHHLSGSVDHDLESLESWGRSGWGWTDMIDMWRSKPSPE